MAQVRYIAAGEANMGFWGKERPEIHRAERIQGEWEGRRRSILLRRIWMRGRKDSGLGIMHGTIPVDTVVLLDDHGIGTKA